MKDDREVTMAVGRILGWVKKKDPQLYEYLVEKAEHEGKKVSDLIVEALKGHYLTPEELLETLSARQLLIIIRKWNEITREMIQWQLEFLRTFWIEGFNKYSEMINAIAESVKEEVKTPRRRISPSLLFDMMERMMTIAMTMPYNIMGAMTGQIPQLMQKTEEKPEILELE